MLGPKRSHSLPAQTEDIVLAAACRPNMSPVAVTISGYGWLEITLSSFTYNAVTGKVNAVAKLTKKAKKHRYWIRARQNNS